MKEKFYYNKLHNQCHESFEPEFNEHFSYFEKKLGLPYACYGMAINKGLSWCSYSIKEWQDYYFNLKLYENDPLRRVFLNGNMAFFLSKHYDIRSEEENHSLNKRLDFLKMNSFVGLAIRSRMEPGSVESIVFATDSKTKDLTEIVADNRPLIFNKILQIRELAVKMNNLLKSSNAEQQFSAIY